MAATAQLAASIGLWATIEFDKMPGYDSTAIPTYFDKEWLEKNNGTPDAHWTYTPTMILDGTMILIALLGFFNGFGVPDDGHKFRNGVCEFDSVNSALELAAPDSRDWSGKAAAAYATQNNDLESFVQQMQNLDKLMRDKVADHAAKVVEIQKANTYLIAGLVGARGVALSLYFLPAYGPEAAFGFQALVAAAALITILDFTAKTIEHSQSVADDIGAIVNQYADVAAAALRIETPSSAELAGAQAGAEKAILGATTLSETSTVDMLVDLSAEGASVGARTVVGALTGDGEPIATPPFAQSPALVSVPASSGSIFPQTALANQTLRPAFAPMDRQARNAPASTGRSVSGETLLAEDAEVAEASVGTLAAGRAPNKVATARLESSQKPWVLERIA